MGNSTIQAVVAPDVVIFASVGSYAWQWAEEQGIPHGTPYVE